MTSLIKPKNQQISTTEIEGGIYLILVPEEGYAKKFSSVKNTYAPPRRTFPVGAADFTAYAAPGSLLVPANTPVTLPQIVL